MINISNSGWYSGLKEWLLQRISGLFIIIYFIYIFLYFFTNDGFTYYNLLNLFSGFYFKIFTVLFSFSLAIHASIGMTIVLTDYVKNNFPRFIFEILVNILLLFYIFCVMQILWG